ncbi:MAG: LPS export ABC transporter permease LptF [Alphaproteobacteria bacterium]|jgi:lipopolysaccharide export system permease protein|nr:LPS export ABC transporter permease LptF [Roseomonas sp.]MCE2759971.1 LPS export ABC transporter permease LptF [Acetobacteraceae bacterium]
MTLLDRYLFRQLALALLAVTVGLAALVWLTQSLRFIELVLDRGLSLAVFFELTSLLLPSFFSVILPITTFIVMLFVHLRLAGDRELVVMRAAGLSNWQIARPALVLGLLVVAVMAFLNFWLVPLSHTAFRQWQFEIRNQLVGVLLQEGVFSTLGNDLTVYARKRDPDGTLRGILVHDQREAGGAVTILAQSGRIGQGPEGPRVTLYDGVRQQMERGASGAPQRLTVLSFSENSVDLARVARNEETRSRDSRERSIAELLDPDPAEGLRPREIRRFQAEAHQRMASPLTALSFALVGLAVALTGQFRRHGGGVGVVLGIGIMVALLALGLTISNAAARRDGLIWLIWLHATLPGVISAWWLAGAPGLPRKAPPREALS